MQPAPTARPRRGWRETVEPGIYRIHRVGCARSADRRPGGRCGCPYQIKAPGRAPGTTRNVTHSGPLPDARAERRRLLAAGRPEPPAVLEADGGVRTVRDLARAWLQTVEGQLAPSTLWFYAAAYRRGVDPALGALPLAELTRARAVAWFGEVARTRSRHGAWEARTALRAVCKFGVQVGLLAENPIAGLRLPRGTGGEPARAGSRRVLTASQLGRLVAACTSTRAEVMVRMSAEAGLRAGEVIGLRWGDLDLAGCRVTVARSVWQESRGRGAAPVHHVKAPKSGLAGTVALPVGLAARLADLYAEAVIDGGAAADGYVFPGRGGKPLDRHAPGNMLRRACARAGLVDRDGRPLVSWHGLRHTAASLMLAQGVPLPDVAAQLRHADPAITARIYSHSLGEDRQHAAAAVFDGLYPTRTVRETVRGRHSEDYKCCFAGGSCTCSHDF